MATAVASAWKIIPSLESSSIEATIKFYIDDLGFTLGGTKSSPPDTPGAELTFCSIFAGAKAAANFYFFQNSSPETFKSGSFFIALGTEELDQLYIHVKGKEHIRIVEPVTDQPWGFRQFSILDPDGNRLTFFKFIEGGNPGAD